MEDIKFVSILEKEDEHLNSYKQLLEREKCHYSTNMEEETKLVITNRPLSEVMNFLISGGTVISEGLTTFENLQIELDEKIAITEIHFDRYDLVDAVFPTMAFKYRVNEKIIENIGYIRTHEKRIIKHGMDIGRCPLIQKIQIGEGILYLSSIKFEDYLNLNGSTLRSIKNKTFETSVSERISQIDKGLINTFLIHLLDEIFEETKIPTIKFDYLPDKAKKVFVFRIDLDGTPTGHSIPDIVDLCNKYEIPCTFFANKFYMEASEDYQKQILSIKGINKLGNHGVVHNIYDTYEGNLENITGCSKWLKELGTKDIGFVAPRGIWNPTLDKALKDAGFEYSSDFGINFNDLPFRVYINNKLSDILQIPVDPYCVGRAEIYKTEIGESNLTDKEILNYYFNYMDDETGKMGNGFVFIYGHPQGIGKRLSVIESIFKKVKNENYKVMSIGEFKDWWIYRESIDYMILKREDGLYELQINDEYTPFIKKCSEKIIMKSNNK